MKRIIAALLLVTFAVGSGVVDYRIGFSKGAAESELFQPTASLDALTSTEKPSPSVTEEFSQMRMQHFSTYYGARASDVRLDMGDEAVTNFLRGKVFQVFSPYAYSNENDLYYFTPEGNEYYWFCSAMDEQERIRAEHGSWLIHGNYMLMTVTELVEWVDGYFVSPEGSTASRFALTDFTKITTDVDIFIKNNFHMFKDPEAYGENSEDLLAFYCGGKEYYHITWMDDEIEEKMEYFFGAEDIQTSDLP